MIVGRGIIKHAFESGEWKAFDAVGHRIAFKDLHLNPHSVDVTLGNQFMTVFPSSSSEPVDPLNPASVVTDTFESDHYILQPGEFLLGYVQERFETFASVMVPFGDGEIPVRCTQLYDGRSTCGRLGIQSHMTAGYGDLGFSGHFTLEITTQVPVVLHSGMRIGQITFMPVLDMGEPEFYTGAYIRQKPQPTAPSLGRHRFF